MAAAPTNSSSFPLFSRLALELRTQIWRAALPDKVAAALYFYNKGSWCPRLLELIDEEHDPENDELDLTSEFRHDIDPVQLDVPLICVNREARGVAIAWASKHGVERRAGQPPIFMCPFDPTRDALYLPLDKWDDFLNEPVGHLLCFCCADVTRIAVPEVLFQSEVAGALAQVLAQWFPRLKVLFIIVDTPPDVRSADDELGMQRRWELETLQQGALFWNGDRGFFDFGDREDVGEALYGLFREANRGLSQELFLNYVRSFEVCSAFAVGR